MHKSLWLIDGERPPSRVGFAESVLAQRGVLHGWRVMTTMTAFGRTIIDVDRHLDRLYAHAEHLGIPAPVRKEVLLFDLATLLEELGSLKARCRVFFSVCEGSLIGKFDRASRWIICDSVGDETATDNTQRLKVVTDSTWRHGMRLKTGNYDFALPGLPKAIAEGYDDVIWCNGDQEICEATTANIFLLGRDGDRVEIATPPETSGLLLGITRQRVIDLLTSAKIPVTVRSIYREEIPRFDEAFLTSSVRGLAPVSEIGGHRLHTLRTNSVFRHIERLWNTWVHTELGHPVDWRTGVSRSS